MWNEIADFIEANRISFPILLRANSGDEYLVCKHEDSDSHYSKVCYWENIEHPAYNGYCTLRATDTTIQTEFTLIDWFEPESFECECGAKAINCTGHSAWCPVFNREAA